MPRAKRVALVAAAAFALVALFAAAASANDDPPGPAVTTVLPRAASHDARITGSEVIWRSTFARFDSYVPRAARIDLAQPFVGRLDLDESPGVTAVLDAENRVVALLIDPARVPGWHDAVVVSFRAALSADGDALVLAPPLARGDEVQRVAIGSADDRRFEPSPSPALLHDVGYWTATGIPDEARRACDAQLGDRAPALDDVTLYVEASSTAVAHGLRGATHTGAERARHGRVGALVLFLALAAGLAALYPWLTRHARVEQAEAILREEFDSLGPHHGRRNEPDR